ncbi:heterokaryon incompatibility protein-domain-containing protein [Paraphoma chrysanthemicola]|uniref:Heterokaryon incompatibility protein-domain-containing protein n=1 Tax=Paraphoma chrysanthemicola TaxID=798071 RepID=A0A8K0R9C4_9PLEO|nr:heterokaryon incompatibility protein-domain-containing protein [Paraphoma chrysanthemicola]
MTAVLQAAMEFCPSCAILSIQLKHFISHPGTDENPRLKDPIRSLGHLHEIRNRYKSCPLCRLVFATYRSGPLTPINRIADLKSIAVFAKWINCLGPDKAERLKSPSTAILIWAEAPNIPSDRYKIVIRAVSDLLPQPHFGLISPVKKSLLNFEQIKTWLGHCETSHHICATTIEAKPTKHFFLIDTRFKCIVEPQECCRYLALSYVWGGVSQYMLSEDNIDKMKERFSIRPQHLTATVRDAIAFTEKLGERYLWVDTLCIIQDSKAIRQQTLQDMGTIYAHSVLTVVAGSSSSANSPLLGVTEERTWVQWYQKVSKTLKISAHFDFKDYLEDAVYSSRAWTYQEYQLAKRLLVFAPNGQVYFSCNSAVYSEEVITGSVLDSDAAMMQGAQLIKVRPAPRRLWSTYKRAAESYTARNLSHQSDVVDAFTGILQILSNGRCVEGIPVAVFEKALLWQPRERMLRRTGFASWSWTGWKGRIRWSDDLNPASANEDEESESVALETWRKHSTWIVWYSCLGTNCRSPAFRMDGPPWLTGTAPEENAQNRRFLGLPQNVSLTPNLLPDTLGARKDQSRSRELRYLQFWTVSLTFEIELDTTAVLRYNSLEPENTGNGMRIFTIRSNAGQNRGWVLLDETWIELIVNKAVGAQEFILLSEVSTHKEWGEASPEHDKHEYNAMMIIWKDGIAERAGLGRVETDASSIANMTWKEVLLG